MAKTNIFLQFLNQTFIELDLLEAVTEIVRLDQSHFRNNSYYLRLEKCAENQVFVSEADRFDDHESMQDYYNNHRFGTAYIKAGVNYRGLAVTLVGHFMCVQYNINADFVLEASRYKQTVSRHLMTADDIRRAFADMGAQLQESSWKPSA